MESKLKFVVKRDNSQVPFDARRIQNAIFSAAQSVGGKDEVRALFLTEQVVEELNKLETQITVEGIQDLVETVLIKQGHAVTAKAYIRYRDRHAQERQAKKEELLEKIGRCEATITDEKGNKEPFDIGKVVGVLGFYCYDLPKIDAKSLVLEAISNLYDGITVKELSKALINAARSKIEIDSQYSLLAARLLLKSLYQEVLGISITKDQSVFKKSYRGEFANYIKSGVGRGLLDERLLEFDIDKLAGQLIPGRDDLFHFRGIQTIYDRYLLRHEGEEIFELPQYFWMRVAMGVALAESKDQKDAKASEFYHLLSEMLYIPSTPTLFNAGTTHAQLSSCFLNSVDDSLDAIFKSYSDNARLSKYAGGLGTNWTKVRSLGSKIKGTNGFSGGVIPFLKIFNDVALAVNQGGKRKGAMCAYLEIWHADIYEFMEAKKNTGDERRRLHDCHTAVWIPDLFMKRVLEDGKWTLFSPSSVPDLHDLYGSAFEERYIAYEQEGQALSKEVSAKSLWRKLLTMTYETGHPWLTFKDPCNIRNPQSHAGVIHNSNLCTEITLNNSSTETAVCNLGSLNLEKFINMRMVDYKMLKSVVRTAIRMLDNVIDINYYPTKEAKHSNMKHRPVGLGLMGYQDALFKMNYPFDSEEHFIFADELLERISYYAIEASSDLAAERGSYQSYAGSFWDRGIFPLDTLDLLEKERGMKIEVNRHHSEDWSTLKAKVKAQGMRNSNCLAIAPTATISNIAGVYPGIEPAFRNIYVKENTDGSFIVINQYLVQELEALGLWDKRMLDEIKYHNGSIQEVSSIPPALKVKYKEAFEIEPRWLIMTAARRAKWIDQSQSLNIFLPHVTGKTLSDTYLLAWRTGLKTTYYLRTLSASQITKTAGEATDYKSLPGQENQKDNLLQAASNLGGASGVSGASGAVSGAASGVSGAGDASGVSGASDVKLAASNKEDAAKKSLGSEDNLNAGLCRLDDPDCEVCQ